MSSTVTSSTPAEELLPPVVAIVEATIGFFLLFPVVPFVGRSESVVNIECHFIAFFHSVTNLGNRGNIM